MSYLLEIWGEEPGPEGPRNPRGWTKEHQGAGEGQLTEEPGATTPQGKPYIALEHV